MAKICWIWGALFGIGAMAGAVTLVRGGRPQATIIVPQAAQPAEQLAAEELQRYIAAVSGALLPIVKEGEAIRGAPVYVGPTKKSAASLPQAPEGIAIQAGTSVLVIGGGSPRGTLFAVYRFLEQALGCRWLAYDVEYVPKKKDIIIAPYKMQSTPAFDMRLFIGRGVERQAWGLKMGLNGLYDAESAARNGNCFYLPQEANSCHAYARIIPADRYYETHPEWFPLINGRRYRSDDGWGQLCVTAPGLADEFARRVLEFFQKDPNLQIMSISPNDGYGWCECPHCLALDKEFNGGRTTKQGLLQERPFMGDRVFWFANQIAERVAKVYPDKRLLVLAYVNYAEPPDTVRPDSNIVPWLCHYAPADYARPIADPASEANAQFNDLLQRWAKLAPRLLFYSYVSKSMWWRLPRPVWRNFAADLKYLYQLGIRRYYCQSGLTDWALDGPLYYVLAKLMWDPSADPEALAQDWLTHMFGTAAPQMKAYYNAVEEAVRKTGRPYADNPPKQVPGLYDPQALEAAQQHLEAAWQAAPEEAIRQRIAEIQKVFAYGRHMIKAIELGERFRQEMDVALLQQVKAEGEKALSYCRVREAQRYLESFRFHEEIGVLAEGLGEPEERGGRRCWNTDETGVGDGKAGWATIYIETPDTTKPVLLEMEVWGTSQLDSIVINTDGTGRGYAQGGVWNPVKPQQSLSGKEEWETLVFRIPPELMATGKRIQRIGMGGGDSQIWIARIRVLPAP